jgi:hypothetical protein
MPSPKSSSYFTKHPVRTAALLLVGVPAALGAVIPLGFALLVIVTFAAPALLLPAVALLVAGGLRWDQPGWQHDGSETTPIGLANSARSTA